jgi:hypothetical protein
MNHVMFDSGQEQGDFLPNNVQTGSGARCYSMGNGGFARWVKRLELEVDHSPLSSVQAKNEWSYIFTPAICLYGMHGDKCFFCLNVCVSVLF